MPEENEPVRPHPRRTGWIAGGLLVAAIVILLAAIAERGMPGAPGSDLAPGESETLYARIVEVLEEGTIAQGEIEQPYQRLRLRITSGTLAGQEMDVEHGLLGLTNQSRMFRVGDRVLVQYGRTPDGEDLLYIADYVRTGPLLWLALLFVAATLLLSGWQGVRSLVGMGVSLIVIAAFIVPQILAGHNPVTIAILGSVVMMGVSLYLVYGWRRKTHVAVAGLLLSLILTALLAVWFVGWARLSGFGAEESAFLQVAGARLDLQGLLLAGIIVGTLGALDDVVINQSSAVFELSKANPSLGWRALFQHGMVIGRDHIAAMVNTLLLAYAGVALPLLLMFSIYTEPVTTTLNREIISEEVVRTLVGSLGLLAGVPLTTLIAALVARAPAPDPDRDVE
ncbi:MAG: YibE/F family protein [Anaerolineae bacterium]|nr:YibE/F family protein [Anaerolineae bacterium]